MRALCLVSLLSVLVPAAASAQSLTPSVSVQAAAGPTVYNAGYHVAGAVGFSPWSRVTFLVNAERTHVFSRSTRSGDVYSEFRGGTMTAVTGEVRVALFPADRVTPYVVGGYGGGVSRPNVNETFPDPVRNDAYFLFVGGGVHVPLRDRLSLFGDIRVLGGAEGTDGTLVMYPVRLGLSWRF